MEKYYRILSKFVNWLTRYACYLLLSHSIQESQDHHTHL